MKVAFTGGPSAGKSTVIRKVEALGFRVVHELATEVINEGVYLPWHNHVRFQFEVLRRQEIAEARLSHITRPVFMDRGVYDAIAYRMVHGWKVQDFLLQLQPQRYDVAFVFPPLGTWDANGVRYEDPDFAREITPYLTRVYEAQGIPVVRVPDGTPEERVAFILRSLKWTERTPQMDVAGYSPAIYSSGAPRIVCPGRNSLVAVGASS